MRRGVEFYSRWIVLRELFHDWEHEAPLDLELVRVGAEGAHPAPLDPAQAARQLRRVGEVLRNQLRYWNEFYAVTLETYADRNGDGKRFMPRNDLNPPNPGVVFGGQATNLYAGGVFELATRRGAAGRSVGAGGAALLGLPPRRTCGASRSTSRITRAA